MSTSLYDLAIGSYTQVVGATIGVLEKGAEHIAAAGLDAQSIVDKSLHPDMADFHFQAVCVAHHSLGAVRGIEAGEFRPPAGYGEMDYAGLQAFLQQTLADLEAVDAHAFNQHADGRLVFKLGDNEIPFSNENFVLSFSLPNLYFHATTAYDILRAEGVALGKMNFLGQLKIG